MKAFGLAVIALLVGLMGTPAAHAEVMTVQQVYGLLQQGKKGKAAAISYAQGVFDGMLAMESLRRQQTGEEHEFCKFFDTNRLLNFVALRTFVPLSRV